MFPLNFSNSDFQTTLAASERCEALRKMEQAAEGGKPKLKREKLAPLYNHYPFSEWLFLFIGEEEKKLNLDSICIKLLIRFLYLRALNFIEMCFGRIMNFSLSIFPQQTNGEKSI